MFFPVIIGVGVQLFHYLNYNLIRVTHVLLLLKMLDWMQSEIKSEFSVIFQEI
jgi:hypothetical protein